MRTSSWTTSIAVWLVAFALPLAATVVDLVVSAAFLRPTIVWCPWFIPIALSLVGCAWAVYHAPLSGVAKLGAAVATAALFALQLVVLVIVFGSTGLMLFGLEGVR